MIWDEFRGLLPRTPLFVAKVVNLHANGFSTVEFPNGSQLRVRGTTVALHQYAFIRDGEIRGVAPAVAPVTLDV